MEITVRKIGTEDTEKLEALYQSLYGERACYKFPERWEWQFGQNPWKGDGIAHIYIAENSETKKIVGHTAAARVPSRIFGTETLLGWSVDTQVFSECRGKGVGTRLQKINQDDHPVFASLGMTPTNLHIKKKLGARVGPETKMMVRSLAGFRKSSGFGKKRWRGFPMTEWIAGVLALFYREHTVEDGSFTVKGPAPAVFGDADTALWEEIRDAYDFAVERGKSYLNWRYCEQPWTRHFCFRAYDGNRLMGLLVYRVADEKTPHVGVITELFGLRSAPSVFSKLIRELCLHLRKEGIYQVHAGSSDPILCHCLEKQGFRWVESKHVVLHGNSSILKGLGTQSLAMLSKGDHDIDQYPLAQVFSTWKLLRIGIKNMWKKGE